MNSGISCGVVAPASVNFTVHPAILDSIISKQSGSLNKALAELVMNSIDADASKVEVTLDAQSFVVADNGKGFENREEIMTCFAEFGTPQTKDKTYGRFRIGRGQCFVWGKVTWRSGPFRMVVDTKHKGLQFEFHENEPFVEGCVVTGELYTPLESYNLKSEIRAFSNMVEYVETDLFLNGSKVNTRPSEKSWMYETEDAYIDIDTARFGHLSVHNLGVFCFNFSVGALGLTGTVVSKKPLTVNFARNQIMTNECKVWRRIEKHLEDVGVNKLLSKRYLSAGEQDAIADRFLSGEYNYLQIRDCPILTDVAGVNLSFATLFKSKAVTARADDTSALADQVHASKVARVLAEKTLERLDCYYVIDIAIIVISAIEAALDSLGESKTRLRDVLAADYKAAQSLCWVSDINDYAPSFNNGFTLIEDKTLKPQEKMALDALRRGNRYICRVLQNAEIETLVIKPRKLYAGNSDSEAWTDGVSYICINRRHLKECHKSPDRFLYVVQLLVHEYLHECQDNQRHYHNELFHEEFHRAILHVKMKGTCVRDLYSVATTIASYYASAMFEAKVEIPESYAQFGGAARDVFTNLKYNLRDTKKELKLFKMASPLVDDPERLCFHKMKVGSKDLCFYMSCAGPFMVIEGNENRWGGGRQLLVKERLAIEFYGGRNENESGLRSYTLRNLYRKGMWERDFCQMFEASQVEVVDLANLLGAYLYINGGDSKSLVPARDPKTDNEGFYISDLCRKYLRAWAEKEPVLAEYCGREPLDCKDWYKAIKQA